MFSTLVRFEAMSCPPSCILMLSIFEIASVDVSSSEPWKMFSSFVSIDFVSKTEPLSVLLMVSKFRKLLL